jgi:MtN3 and saliva related transmembrane protein
MEIKILDPNVNLTMNIFIIIGNFITVFQNVPQVIKTYKVKSTRDFSAIFLFMRLAACFIWGAYSIEINSLLMLINNLITLLSTMFISFYKMKEIISDYKLRRINKYMQIQNNQNNLFINQNNLDNNIDNNIDNNFDDNIDYKDEIIISL